MNVAMGGWSLFDSAGFAIGTVPIETISSSLRWQMLMKSLLNYSANQITREGAAEGTYLDTGAGGTDLQPATVTGADVANLTSLENSAYNKGFDDRGICTTSLALQLLQVSQQGHAWSTDDVQL
jgi:hypothetical protein